jgi:hypothetical protein
VGGGGGGQRGERERGGRGKQIQRRSSRRCIPARSDFCWRCSPHTSATSEEISFPAQAVSTLTGHTMVDIFAAGSGTRPAMYCQGKRRQRCSRRVCYRAQRRFHRGHRAPRHGTRSNLQARQRGRPHQRRRRSPRCWLRLLLPIKGLPRCRLFRRRRRQGEVCPPIRR